MGFHSSHGKIHWSFGNYTKFISELHDILNDREVEQFNIFDAHAHSENGYDPEKCKSLAEILSGSIQYVYKDDTKARLEQLIEALREAHAAKEPLRFI